MPGFFHARFSPFLDLGGKQSFILPLLKPVAEFSSEMSVSQRREVPELLHGEALNLQLHPQMKRSEEDAMHPNNLAFSTSCSL